MAPAVQTEFENIYPICYEFRFSGRHVETFDLKLDPQTFALLNPPPFAPPSWTLLDNHRCRCCPLDPKTRPLCPVAVNISTLIECFKNIISIKKCRVRCQTPERVYQKETTTMEGLSSVLGIVMATSNCPVMDFFRPMARFHLPFSTVEETMVRSVSMYLLRQYFSYQRSGLPDLSLNGLHGQYHKVHLINEGLLKRIGDLKLKKDADKNALLVFHSFSQLLSFELNTGLKSIAYLFSDQGNDV